MQGFLFCLLKLLSKEDKNYGSKEKRKIVSSRRIGTFLLNCSLSNQEKGETFALVII